MLDIERIDTFYGKSHIIKEVSLTVQEAEVVSLIGRNGAGKTTLLRTIMGLTPPQSGTIRFRGERVTGARPFELARRGIGFVFEDRRIFPDLTVRDNLEVFAISRRNRKNAWTYERVMEVFSILKKLENHRGNNLSGGEQQLLAIARTLMGNPSLLLLDEPSEGLAPLIVKSLGHLFQEIRREVTILLAEQNLKFALSFTDRVYVIDKGRIEYEGIRDDFLQNRELQERFLGVSS